MKVVLNVHAGDGPEGDDRVQQLQQALKAHALDAQVEIPNDGESLTECAERLLYAGAQTLVAAGGDGTIAALAGPCHAAGAVLGVIPMGTFNYFARAHGIPEALDDAVKTLAHTSSRPVTLGRVNDRIFLNNASIGLYPTILRAREDVYARYGRSRFAAYWSVLKTLGRRPRSMRLDITLDGVDHQMSTPLAFVAASAYQLDEFGLDGLQDHRNGSFALLIAPQVTQSAMLRTAGRLAVGLAEKGPDYMLYTARDIVIRPRLAKILVACDGEKMQMDTPLRMRQDDRPLHLIAPQETS